MDINVLSALFRNQSISRWCCVVCVDILHICPHTDRVTVPPSPSIKYTLQQEDTSTVVQKFQHILGLCSCS